MRASLEAQGSGRVAQAIEALFGTAPKWPIEAVRAQGRAVVLRGWADLARIDDTDDCFVVGEVNPRERSPIGGWVRNGVAIEATPRRRPATGYAGTTRRGNGSGGWVGYGVASVLTEVKSG